ncbi:hypothetical protein ACQU0X_26960 [Pseudovibrio ascidiaceicola]|uniref:hypothetical protein n=1 Tax=Pseudovibrio ascidiaceicola TaxID=285279 RepID=UPI003D36424F
MLFSLSSLQALADPQGLWPEEVYGFPLEPVDWILLIPASRRSDGTLELSGLSWLSEKYIPFSLADGTWVVPLKSDKFDHDTIDAEQLDAMMLTHLQEISTHYHAPAIALAVKQSPQVAIAAWAEGQQATWVLGEQGEGSVRLMLESIFSAPEDD